MKRDDLIVSEDKLDAMFMKCEMCCRPTLESTFAFRPLLTFVCVVFACVGGDLTMAFPLCKEAYEIADVSVSV